MVTEETPPAQVLSSPGTKAAEHVPGWAPSMQHGLQVALGKPGLWKPLLKLISETKDRSPQAVGARGVLQPLGSMKTFI